MPKMVRIIVDSREKNSMVIAELADIGAETELRHLKVADYLVGEVAIERKTISDFVSSMINKRLLKQLEELSQYEQRILVIEGTDEKCLYNDDAKTGVHANAIRGMLLSSMLNFRVPILFTKDARDTASFLKVLANRMEKQGKSASLKVKKKAYNVSEQQQFILEGFPGIGPNTAKALLSRFKTIKEVVNADGAELEKVKNLGRKKAGIIKGILEKNYEG